jgi:hypothetical protein
VEINNEYQKYNDMLTIERKAHIKANMATCNLCKQVAKTNNDCLDFFDESAANSFILAMKKYLEFYQK